MRTWRTLFPLRSPKKELPTSNLELRGHELVIVTDDGDGRGLRIGRRAFLDGAELFLADGASVVVEVSNTNLVVANLRVIAEVQFVEDVTDSEEGSPDAEDRALQEG